MSARLMGASFVFKYFSYVARSHSLIFRPDAYFHRNVLFGTGAANAVYGSSRSGRIASGTTCYYPIFPFSQGF